MSEPDQTSAEGVRTLPIATEESYTVKDNT